MRIFCRIAGSGEARPIITDVLRFSQKSAMKTIFIKTAPTNVKTVNLVIELLRISGVSCLIISESGIIIIDHYRFYKVDPRLL